ncbi:MAG: molybdopterin-dependent oxidoreductase [Candidatus Acidiferrales bacterium]
MPEPTKNVTFTLNGKEIVVAPGTLVIEAARRLGTEVPSFCYYPGLSLQAACRMCLVEVEKAPKLQTACTLVATPGMIVRTDTEQVHAARKNMLEFLLTNHPLDCPVCDKGGECELQDMVFRYGADKSRFAEEKLHRPEEKWSELVYYDAPRCILCFRCVRVCDEGMDVKALGVGQRGVQSVILPNREGGLDCEECGMCIDICPVGALTSGTYRYQTRPWEMNYVPTVCTHCSNGCKTTLSVRNHEILRANNRDLSGYNKDFLCVKGRFGFDFTRHPQRLREPLVRRNGALAPASWEDAIGEIAARLAAVQKKHGASGIGVIGSNRTTNEENYLLGRLARASLGTNNIDHHRTADYAGLVAEVGKAGKKDATSFATMGDLESAGAFLVIANDPTEENPLVAWQIRAAIRHFASRLYIINSSAIKLGRKAAQFVETAGGGEAAAVKWLATGQGNVSDDAKKSLDALRSAIEKETDLVILFGAGIAGGAIADLVAWGAARAGRTRFMALGDYANSRGAADMGLLPDRLPGYAHISDATARGAFGKLWDATLPDTRGLNASQMMEAAFTGRLPALYVVGANPVETFGRAGAARPAGLELLVVHELFLTETARMADVVLPAACLYEKDGTATNTAGEVQLVRKASELMGPRSDFDLLRLLSHQLARLGVGQPFPLRTPAAAFEEIREHVPGYGVPWAALLGGAAEPSAPMASPNGQPPAGLVFSAHDTLFTSGSMSRYLNKINALSEAAPDGAQAPAPAPPMPKLHELKDPA